MKRFLPTWVIILQVVVAPFVALSDQVEFDLIGNANMYSVLDDAPMGVVEHGGLIMTLTASDGVLNRTASGFGINGPGPDDTDALNLGQYVDIDFDQTVNLMNVNISSWGTGSVGEVLLGSGSTFESKGLITAGGTAGFDFQIGEADTLRVIATGQTSSTNGFSLDGFTVETIPEPMTMGLVSMFGAGMLYMRKRFSP